MPASIIKSVSISNSGAYSIPGDFVSFISVEAVGAGGYGLNNNGSSTPSGGGGGGGYSKSTSVTGLTAGQTVYTQVSSGGDTWFNTVANSAPTLSSQGVLAKAGSTATSSIGGLGGQAASGVGDGVKYSGGQGGSGATSSGCGGGGGAAGPGGNGGNGGNGLNGTNLGAGGGGSSATLTAAGTTGSNGSSGAGGAGGASTGQTGGTGAPNNSTQATSGKLGGGNGGAVGTSLAGPGATPSVSGSGFPFAYLSNGNYAYIFGGSGGAGQGTAATQIAAGYGGGMGGGRLLTTNSPGVLVFTYYAAPSFSSREGDLEQLFVTDYAMIDQYAATGTLWLWGRNTQGQLGDGSSIVHRSSPIQTVSGGTNWKQVASGGQYTAVIKTDGTLWTLGHNTSGVLGDGSSIVHRSSPIQTVAGGTNWKLVAGGGYHIAAIKTDGTLWLWGSNTSGQLGDNTVANKSSPVQTVAGGTNWKQVAGGGYHTAAIKTDGTLWTWGQNNYGQLGDNTSVFKSSPVQTIAGGTNWKSVAGGNFHTAAIKTDGTLWTWGFNSTGQLGNNISGDKSSPVQTVAAGTNWKLVAGGFYHTAAIKTDGTLWTWGHNTYGQLGDGFSIVHKSSPVQTVSGGTNWKLVADGGYYTAAIKTDGTLWNWGNNTYGQLGDNSIVHRSSPIQTLAGGTNWKLVAGGGYHTAAVFFYEAGKLYPPS